MNRSRQWGRAHWRAAGEATFYVLAGAALFGLLLLMLRRTMALHADGLWVFSLAQDLLNGTPMRGWKPSALPLYFPELTSILVWRAAGLSVPATILVYGALSWALISGGVWWGARLSGAGRVGASKLAFLVLLIGVALHAQDRLLATFQNPFSHGGSTLGTFLGLLWVGRALKHGVGPRSAIPVGAVLALLVASDLAIIVQLVAPALLCLLVFWCFSWAQRRRAAWVAATLAAGTAGGRLLTLGVEKSTGLAPEPIRMEPTWSAAKFALARVVEDLSGVARDQPLLFLGALLPVVALGRELVLLLGEPKSASRELQPEGLFSRWMCCASLASLGSTLSGVILSDSWAGLASHRYILPLLLLPVPFVLIVMARCLSRLAPPLWRVCEVTLLAVAVVVGKPVGASLANVADASVPRYTCLDNYVRREGLHAGYAQFWSARPSTMLSQARLTINQVDNRWKPYSWLNNSYWYSRGYWRSQARPLQYDFAITNGLDEQWIADRFGAPRAKRSCFDLKIWVYDRPEDAEFRNYLRSYAARATGDRDGWWESPHVAEKRALGQALTFDGASGVALAVPHVRADVVEVASPTRKPLSLTYRLEGVDLAQQRIEFGKHDRRLVPIPLALEADGFDSVFIEGDPDVTHELTEFALIVDRGSFKARPVTVTALNDKVAHEVESPR